LKTASVTTDPGAPSDCPRNTVPSASAKMAGAEGVAANRAGDRQDGTIKTSRVAGKKAQKLKRWDYSLGSGQPSGCPDSANFIAVSPAMNGCVLGKDILHQGQESIAKQQGAMKAQMVVINI